MRISFRGRDGVEQGTRLGAHNDYSKQADWEAKRWAPTAVNGGGTRRPHLVSVIGWRGWGNAEFGIGN